MPANVDPIYVIKKPLLSEKSTYAMNEYKLYAFEVDPRATKDEIKNAIEQIYKVRVEAVNTQVRKHRSRMLKYGMQQPANTKKATVRLHPEDSIELF
ncbi:MAG TPA: 50S ribosomal protein L23 [Phycisphaerales bacterium]|nr:50S ribosomal protein L23 [Phycisphaerales bacterium]